MIRRLLLWCTTIAAICVGASGARAQTYDFSFSANGLMGIGVLTLNGSNVVTALTGTYGGNAMTLCSVGPGCDGTSYYITNQFLSTASNGPWFADQGAMSNNKDLVWRANRR